jgi:hypothetical protein
MHILFQVIKDNSYCDFVTVANTQLYFLLFIETEINEQIGNPPPQVVFTGGGRLSHWYIGQ